MRQEPQRRGKILRPATLRTPAAIADAELDRGIERGAIHTSLSTGENFHARIVIPVWPGIQ
jgi:hypothetical protein